MAKFFLLNKNPISAKEQAGLLEAFGHEVIVFHQLDSLVGAMTYDPPRLILVDKLLADNEAYGWVAKIKAERPRQAVVILMNYSEQGMLKPFIKEGIQDCIFKPLNPEILYLRTQSYGKKRQREIAPDLFHEFEDEDDIKYAS